MGKIEILSCCFEKWNIGLFSEKLTFNPFIKHIKFFKYDVLWLLKMNLRLVKVWGRYGYFWMIMQKMQLRFQREPILKNVWNSRILMNYGLVQHLEKKCKAQCLYAQSFHLRWNKLRGIKPTFDIDGVFDLL